MLVYRGGIDMQEKLTKKEDRPSAPVDCTVDTCKFPQTCKWNLKCMQRELTVSMRGKEMEKEKMAKRKSGSSLRNA